MVLYCSKQACKQHGFLITEPSLQPVNNFFKKSYLVHTVVSFSEYLFSQTQQTFKLISACSVYTKAFVRWWPVKTAITIKLIRSIDGHLC